MPDVALAGEKGKTVIRFRIQPDGKAEDISVEGSSGNDLLDQAAIKGIQASTPFEPLPPAFKGPSIELRLIFLYNLPLGYSGPAPDPAPQAQPIKNPSETEAVVAAPKRPQPDDCFYSGNVYTNTFFVFTYEFPKGWTVLSAEAGRVIMRLGESVLASRDPTVPGITEPLERNEYPLLVVAKQTAQGVATTVSMIQIHAFHIGTANDSTADEELLKLLASS